MYRHTAKLGKEITLLTVLISASCQNNIPQMGPLKEQTFISHSSGHCKSMTELPADEVSGEGSLPSLRMASFSVSPPCVSSYGGTSLTGSGFHSHAFI